MLDDSSVKTPILLVGDMNTVLPQTTELNNLWYKKRPFSYRSYLLYEFLYENNLIVANFHFTQDKHFTFSKSYIDHIFLPMYMYMLPMVKDCATSIYT